MPVRVARWSGRVKLNHTVLRVGFEGPSRACGYIYTHKLRTRYAGEIEGCDISYRCLLWQGIDHLLAIGHSFAYIRRGQDTTGMQVRTLVRLIGQADEVGMAFGIELATMLNCTDRPDVA